MVNCRVHTGNGDHHEPCELGANIHARNSCVNTLLKRICGLWLRFRSDHLR